MLLLAAVLCGVCAMLVTVAASVGSSRPEREFTGTAPQSRLEADYSADAGLRRTTPLKAEIAAAAARDIEALGLALPGVGMADGEGNAGTREGAALENGAPGDGFEPEAGRGASTAPTQQPSIPVSETAMAVLAVGGVVCAVYLLRRPARD